MFRTFTFYGWFLPFGKSCDCEGRKEGDVTVKLGVMAALFGKMEIDQALAYCQRVGIQAIELPVGAYPGDPWLLNGICNNATQLAALKTKIIRAGLVVQGIAVHGNPVHPDASIAKAHKIAHRNAVLLAHEFETVVVAFSGCPGGCKGDKTPNFVTCPWPEEYSKASAYQWNEVLIPHWTIENEFAEHYGVKIALEAHPGMTVHNPGDIMRLRELAGKQIGANFDPSHFFWQGINPIIAAQVLGEAKCIFHVHAKDCRIDLTNSGVIGNLDIQSYADVNERAWVFCTVGYGHGDEFWKPFIRVLRQYNYDGVISIEHEDSLMSMQEGFEKAIAYLKPMILTQPVGKAWWFEK